MAAADLSAMSDFRGPKVGGQVTVDTLFRGSAPGCLAGPYLSQFFWHSQPFGAQHIEPRMRTRVARVDYMTQPADWLAVQNGVTPGGAGPFDAVLRYMRNGRDLGEWVHIDVLFQAYFQALLALMTPPDPSNPFTGGGLGAPLNPGNPYAASKNQIGFGTFGGPYFATILCEVATRALKAVWFQKWFVHRRLRPEEFGGRIHHHIVSGKPYPIHADALGSAALARVYGMHGTYLLPQAFPEGCPVHPAYGAGHATVAGACVTILKALFDGSHVIPNPVVASTDGLSLVPYTGPDVLTVEGELNKLAANVAIGRNIAGVHWRTDMTASLALGEEVAICVLRDQRFTYNETFGGFTFNRFDGTPFTI
jgi:membrane-associated phospholipid phosphatase